MKIQHPVPRDQIWTVAYTVQNIEVFELRTAGQVDGRQPVVIDIQLHQLAVLGDVQLAQPIHARVDPLTVA